MTALLEIVQTAGVFLSGLLVRVGVVALIAGLLVLPVVVGVLVVRACRSLLPTLRGLRRVGGVLYKPGARYSAGHTWIERDGERLKVGIDGIAQNMLPWALGVELPKPGSTVLEGQVVAIVSCGREEARITAPLSGKVVAVNAEVEREPALLKNDGFGRGWLFAIEPDDARWATLPAGDVARTWMEGEAKRLDRFLELRLGRDFPVSASDPAPKLLLGADWRELTQTFLHA